MYRELSSVWIFPRCAVALAVLLVALIWPASGQPPAAPAPGLPPDLDADGDGFYNDLERALGSDPNSREKTPEHSALLDADGNGVADVCQDLLDNDQDGRTDADDPGCAPLAVSPDLEAGLDIFSSTATVDAGSFGTGVPPQQLKLAGPAVVRRGDPDGGSLPVEMIALQLNGPPGTPPVFLIEDPAKRSTGTVKSEDGAPPWSSTFTMNTLLVVGGRVVRHDPILLENRSISHLPPVQDSRKIDPSKCYRWAGGLHCPEVPRLRIPVLKYVAKFDCGEQPSTPPPFWGAVKPGDYATKIVIHNPQGTRVNAEKKVSEGRRNPDSGPISKFESVTLKPDATTEIDCKDIFRLLGAAVAEGSPLPFKNGVVVILSQKKLDVIANYTQETPKEEIDFRLQPPANAPPPLRILAGKRLKIVTLVTEDRLIDEEAKVKDALRRLFPPPVIDGTCVEIIATSLGVGSSMDVEPIEPQKCILTDPPDLPEGTLDCEAL